MTDNTYDSLIEHVRGIALLESTAAVLSWDQETMMPPRGIEHRARQMSMLALEAHDRSVAPEVGEMLAACEAADRQVGTVADVREVNLRELRRNYDRACRLPAALVGDWAETTSLAQHAWTDARAASDFARFQPWLEKLTGLARRKAECYGWPAGGEAWDALAEDFEPGATAASIEPLFRSLRTPLVALLDRLRTQGTRPDDSFARAELPRARQEQIVRHVSAAIGFDFERGRLDTSAHPFTIGIHPTDVRITTRFGAGFLDALGSTMHEVGHGMYEQGLPLEHAGTPRGQVVSLGIHESQSRLWENQVGRSRPFWTWLQPQLEECFGSVAAGPSEALYRAANIVQPQCIRVEADETSYNLHVMVRFVIETALMRGELTVAEIPGEWNRLYQEYLGLAVPDDARGCLQDVHWSCGMFGYFPTYTLGNLYSAQFFAAAQRALPDLDAAMAAGDFDALLAWLRRNIHASGQRLSAADLCQAVTGRPLETGDFLAYLERKLLDVYECDGPSR